MAIRPMRILNTDIGPGKTVLYFDIAKLHTRTSIEVPIIIERARKDGPTLLLLAGIHGNEVNGVEIVRQLITKKYTKPQFGTIICIPVVNVFGFLNQTREFPDGRDLNRVFPGSKKGSLAARYANKIMLEIVPHVDYCMDFHTGGSSRFNFSQVRIDANDEVCFSLAKEFGTKFILDSKLRDKSFRAAVSEFGKKVILFEGGKSLDLDKAVTKSGIRGALRVINKLGLRDFSQEIANMPKVNEQILVENSTWIRANHSGMYRRVVSIGEKVNKGDIIGSITDPYGDFEKNVKATHTGYIICSNHAPIVNQGDALVHITTEHKTLEADS
jgi:predicted deacylase